MNTWPIWRVQEILTGTKPVALLVPGDTHAVSKYENKYSMSEKNEGTYTKKEYMRKLKRGLK